LLFARLRGWLRAIFVDGPDPVRPAAHENPSNWQTLLAWPVRLLAVGGATVVAWIWSTTPPGVQLGWALQYVSLAAVAVVTSFWRWILLLNVITSVLWLALSWRPPAPPPPEGSGPRWGFLDVVTWVNRQIGHIEALAAWIAVAFVLSPSLTRQFASVAAIGLLGGPIINGIAASRFVGDGAARESRAALLMERRSTIYLASLLGLIVLALQAPYQLGAIMPLLLTVVPCLGIRYARFRRRKYLEQTGGHSRQREVRENRLKRAELQRHAALKGDVWVAGLWVGGFFALVVGLSLAQRHHMEAQNRTDLDGPAPPTGACVAEPGGPVTPTIGLFVLADTQLHELGNKRFPGQMELADTFVPVARRPVELDMLSTATVLRMQDVYLQWTADRQAANLAAPLWAHLGDFADLSCKREIDRMLVLLGDYGCPQDQHGRQGECSGPPAKVLAGVAPGNHDMSFQGNFGWSPYWDEACGRPSKKDHDQHHVMPARYVRADVGGSLRLDKIGSDAAIGDLYQARLVEGAISKPQDHWAPSRVFGKTRTSRFTITPLGAVPLPAGAPHEARGVVAIFYDTSDRKARDYGIAGSNGAVSAEQTEDILGAVRALREQHRNDEYADPWYVLLGHHPFGELTSSSQRHLKDLVSKLDGGDTSCGEGDREDCSDPHVLALVSAHTHIAESHRHCIGRRVMREIIVGSVIDPPQQAALLEVGLDANHRAAVRLSTVPAVARPGLVCPAKNYALDASACRRVMGDLASAPACQDLVRGADADGTSGDSCDSLERPLSVGAQIAGIVAHGGPADPEALKAIDNKRARALLTCVCRDVPLTEQEKREGQTSPQPPPVQCATLKQPLTDEYYFGIIKALAERNSARRDELACLSWAASSLQAHKATGMTMADALRCAFDDPTLAPAQVTVAAAEEQACR